MADAPKLNCRFLLLRYVPNVVRGESVNIGLVLVPPQAPPELRFSKDWSRVRDLDPEADLELLEAFRNELSLQAEQGLLLDRMSDSFSNVLQVSESKACLASAPSQEADELARMYLGRPRRVAARETGPRVKILRGMQHAFEASGAWPLMQKDIPAAQYSRPGDPLKIDCGYKANATLAMFHALSLRTEITAAKALAFSYSELSSGIRRVEGSQARLTAVLEDGLERNSQIEFALDTLQRHAIQVATIADLPALAALAATELRIAP